MLDAAITAVRRRLIALDGRRLQPYGQPLSDEWGLDIESCGAEKLVAKTLNVYWHAIYSNERLSKIPGDVGTYQVRHTHRLDGSLILHERDKDDVPFILVVGAYPNYLIKGWILGKDGKHPRHWRASGVRHPAFFVPPSSLNNLDSLP